MKLDILAIVAHPDDAELCAGGTIIKHIAQGKKVGIVDMTRGELGTRGNAETRKAESAEATEIMGVQHRTNLDLGDGFFEETETSLKAVIGEIRKCQPDTLITNVPEDRHPDHGRACKLVQRAAFLSGLQKIETNQPVWRPKIIIQSIQDYYHEPDFVVDVSEQWNQRMRALLAYRTQFYQGGQQEGPQSPISSKEFLDFIESRAREFGRIIGVEFGEGFLLPKAAKVEDFTKLF